MKEFEKFFSGLDRDFGFCNVKNGYIDSKTNKLKFDPGDYGWAKRPIVSKDYEDHLSGIKSIGLQPCDDQGMASFGAIDVDPDDYEKFDLKKYLSVIEKNNLPVIPIESKSGGLHIYVFTKEKVSSTLIREFLSNILFLFGLPAKTEIFPKQTSLGTNQHGEKTSGSFINLPYFKKTERKAFNLDGSKMELDFFLKTVELNLQTKESLEEVSAKKVSDILTGGPEDLLDGPPCLRKICKDIIETGKKLEDERDRFLYNYMVFAKKKYKDDWEKKVLQAARDYIKYDDIWGDGKVEEKIKYWKRDTAGFKCNDLPISAYCAKGICLKTKYGIGGHFETEWPAVSGLIRVLYKPDHEYYFDIDVGEGRKVQVHAKNIKQFNEMKQMRSLIADYTTTYPPVIKEKEYQQVLNGLWSTMQTLQPPAGTTPLDTLKKALFDFVNGPRAKTYVSFKSGSVLEEEDHYYFIYDKFYEELRRGEWNLEKARTATMIKQYFKGEFNYQKRFPKGENEEAFPPLRVLKLPKQDLSKEEIPDELLAIEDKEDIV